MFPRGASIADGKMSTSMWAKATGLRHWDISVVTSYESAIWGDEPNMTTTPGSLLYHRQNVTVAPAIKHCQSETLTALMWLADLQVKACSRTGPNHLQTSELPTEQNPHDTVFFSKLLENGNKSLKHWNRTKAGHSSPFAFDSFTTIPMEHSHIA